MTVTAPRYVMTTVLDFLAVPEDRIDACLSEFALFLRIAHPAADLLTCLSDEVNGADAIHFSIGKRFEWVDDGKRTMTIRVQATQTSEETEW